MRPECTVEVSALCHLVGERRVLWHPIQHFLYGLRYRPFHMFSFTSMANFHFIRMVTVVRSPLPPVTLVQVGKTTMLVPGSSLRI
jgi:hypothetical protein